STHSIGRSYANSRTSGRASRRPQRATPPDAHVRMAVDRTDTGYLLALAGRRWNEILEHRFEAAGFAEVRASYGALLVPLFEDDGLRLGELARRARLSKQAVTTMSRLLERDGLVTRQPDATDGRATRLFLTARAR